MKAFARMAVLSVSILGLAACASSGGMTSYNAAQKPYAGTRIDNDNEYMAKVEAMARRRGVDLTWVNPPKKIVARED